MTSLPVSEPMRVISLVWPVHSSPAGSILGLDSGSGFCCWLQCPRLHSLCKKPTHPNVSCLHILDKDKGPAGEDSGGRERARGLRAWEVAIEGHLPWALERGA